MKKNILAALTLLAVTFYTHAQINLGVVFESKLNFVNKENDFTQNLNAGLLLKKPITKDFNFITGLTVRSLKYSFTSIDYLNELDFLTYLRDSQNNTYFTLQSPVSINPIYLSIPVGVECKLLPFLRLEYNLGLNYLIHSNKDVSWALEYGNDALNTLLFTSNITPYIYYKGISIGVGYSLIHNSIINTTKEYHYLFMQEFNSSITHSHMITIRMGYDIPLISKKRIL